MKKIRQSLSALEILSISRPLWWIFTSLPFLLVYTLLSDSVTLFSIAAFLFFFFPYNLAMYGINDIFDYETDIRNPRKTNVLAKSKHVSLWSWIAVICMPFIVYLLSKGSLEANLWLVLMLFMVVAYSAKNLRWKEVALLDSITSSFHYTSPVFYALILTGYSKEYVVAFIAYFLWAMGNHAFGAIQDIKPDKEARIRSVATQLGALNTSIYVLFLYSTAAVISAYFYGTVGLLAAILIAMNITCTAYSLRYRLTEDHPIYRKMWIFFTYLNYFSGMIITIALIIAKAES